MKCPYCGSDAIKTATGNEEMCHDEGGLYVVDNDGGDAYDCAISLFVCVESSKHRFYCDDLNGNILIRE